MSLDNLITEIIIVIVDAADDIVIMAVSGFVAGCLVYMYRVVPKKLHKV